MTSAVQVTILDCGHGNLGSVANAFITLDALPQITTDPETVRNAPVLVFPGQGAAPAAMQSLRASGLDDALRERVRSGLPTLGICLGMQLALKTSCEGPVDCLNIVAGESVGFQPTNRDEKVPQIGWNTVRHSHNPLFAHIASGSYFYFVHSYYCRLDPDLTIGWTQYGLTYASALQVGNLWATQFHPEKSGSAGLRLLSNFLDLAQC